MDLIALDPFREYWKMGGGVWNGAYIYLLARNKVHVFIFYTNSSIVRYIQKINTKCSLILI